MSVETQQQRSAACFAALELAAVEPQPTEQSAAWI